MPYEEKVLLKNNIEADYSDEFAVCDDNKKIARTECKYFKNQMTYCDNTLSVLDSSLEIKSPSDLRKCLAQCQCDETKQFYRPAYIRWRANQMEYRVELYDATKQELIDVANSMI